MKKRMIAICMILIMTFLGVVILDAPVTKMTSYAKTRTVTKKKVKYKKWSPKSVVKKLNTKLKKRGLSYEPDSLKKMLEAGEISKEVYERCYPDSGMAYYVVSCKCNLNANRMLNGKKINTEKKMVNYLASYYEDDYESFYVKYKGIRKSKSGTKYYVFYLYYD